MGQSITSRDVGGWVVGGSRRWCRFRWMALQSGDACCQGFKVGLNSGDQSVGDVPEVTTVVDDLGCQEFVCLLDAFVQIVKEVISLPDVLVIGRDVGCQEVVGLLGAFVQLVKDFISLCKMLIQIIEACAEGLNHLELVAQGINACINAVYCI